MVKSKNFKGSGVIIGLILLLVVVTFVIAMTWLSNLSRTTTYYVLAEDIPTKTLIVPEMLVPVVTSEGTEPANIVPIETIQEYETVSQIPLMMGDPITKSVTSSIKVNVSIGIPDSWVVTSFGVNADNAVGGRIQFGTYFDLLVTVDEKTFYPFVNILALDTTVSMDSASSADAVNTEEAYAGQTSQYVVGMPPGDAARLQNLMSTYGSEVKLVISPLQNDYMKPDINAYRGAFTWNSLLPDIMIDTPEPINMGEGTNNLFEDVDRDEKTNKPVRAIKNCSAGNRFIPANENGLCDDSEQEINEDSVEIDAAQSE